MGGDKIGEIGFQEYLLLFTIVAIILFLIALISILKNRFKGSPNKAIWVFIVFILPILGLILYFTIGRKQRIKGDSI